MEIVKLISVCCGLLPFAYIYFCWLFGLTDMLYDFLEKVFYAILSIGLTWKGLAIFINWCTSNNYDEDDIYAVEVYKGSQVYVPTLQAVSNQKTPLEAKETVKSDIPAQSRGEDKGFDFNKYKQGSPEAANAYKNSEESKVALDKLRTLDQLIEEARKVKNV